MANLTTEIFVEFHPKKQRKKYRRKHKHHSWCQRVYRVLGFESYSETGKGYAIISNDRGELWWVENRDLRVVHTKRINSDYTVKNATNV